MWALFRALHLVVCNRHDARRDYFMCKYEDLYEFYIFIKDELAYEINLGAGWVEWNISIRLYSARPKILIVDMRGDLFSLYKLTTTFGVILTAAIFIVNYIVNLVVLYTCKEWSGVGFPKWTMGALHSSNVCRN